MPTNNLCSYHVIATWQKHTRRDILVHSFRCEVVRIGSGRFGFERFNVIVRIPLRFMNLVNRRKQPFKVFLDLRLTPAVANLLLHLLIEVLLCLDCVLGPLNLVPDEEDG
jgi:hypothetical protein